MRHPSRHLSRRAVLGAPLVLAGACRNPGAPQAAEAPAPLPSLAGLAPFPIGTCAMTEQLADPQFTALLTGNFNQLTPEWEMKMEAILKDDGSLDFTASDAIAAVAANNGMRLHATTLIWHEQKAQGLARLDGDKARFKAAYRDYILKVVGRYRGAAAGWDVVNEPVRNDSSGYYESMFSRNLGDAHIPDAFFIAREADPTAVLFLNEYNLELMPEKRTLFLRLVERVLKTGAPLNGLGTQTHLAASSKSGLVTAALKDLASFGLPIHVSELDVSTQMGSYLGVSQPDRLKRQAALVAETVEAFMALPAAQRYALTVWGVRDKDAWKARPPNDGSDQPLLFDSQGRPKPAARAFAAALAG